MEKEDRSPIAKHGQEVPLLPANMEDWEAQTAQNRRASRTRTAWSVARYILLHILVPILVVLITFGIRQEYFEKHNLVKSDSIVLKAYGSNKHYMSLDKKYDVLWENDLRTPQFTISKEFAPDPAAIGDTGGWGMFHDLHCVASLRKALQEAYYGTKPGLDQDSNGHWPHCMHHLRQSILCRADDTVEVNRLSNNSLGAQTITGAMDVRKCGSSDLLVKRMDKSVAAGTGWWNTS